MCGDPYPCETARANLKVAMNSIQLATYMWGYLDDAAHDMPTGRPADLFDRFLTWTR